jgi:Zn finger protein HypA/HybF involved in hydrogenase expression
VRWYFRIPLPKREGVKINTKKTITTLEDAVDIALQFFGDNIPTTVKEYESNFPKGMGRTAIKSNLDITISQFLKLLNPKYVKTNERINFNVLLGLANKLDFNLVDYTLDNSINTTVTLECKHCGKIQRKSYKSLANCVKGCVYCKAKNVQLKFNKDRINSSLERVGASLVSDIPDSQTGIITLKCNKCLTEYSTQLVGLVSPNSLKRGTCPNCRNSDYRVVYNNITFGSNFELECYKLICKYNIAHLELQVPYKEFGNTDRRWVCDFLLDSTIIEVSTFKSDYKGYKTNLSEKRQFIEHSTTYDFEFFDSLKELESYLNARYSLNVY